MINMEWMIQHAREAEDMGDLQGALHHYRNAMEKLREADLTDVYGRVLKIGHRNIETDLKLSELAHEIAIGVAPDKIVAQYSLLLGKKYESMEEILKALPYYETAMQLDNSVIPEIEVFYFGMKLIKKNWIGIAINFYGLVKRNTDDPAMKERIEKTTRDLLT